MAKEREVVLCTKREQKISLAVSFPHSAAANDIKRSFAAKTERMIDMKFRVTPRILAYGAILVALNIVLTRLLSINVFTVRIGFNFIPIALGSMIFGPSIGALLAVIADVLGMLMSGGMPWLGFTVNAALYGISYGLFLQKDRFSTKKLIICVILQAIIIDATLGALWYNHYVGTPFWAALGARAVDAAAMIPVKILVIKYMYKLIGDRIKV